MKLYSDKDKVTLNFSIEEFCNYYQTAEYVSTEALIDYFYKVKDVFSTVYNRFSGSINDKIVTDILSTQYQTLGKVKRLNFVDIKDIFTSKPENFYGKYVDYTLDLIQVSQIFISHTESTLNNLKLAISSFMNEYSENKVVTIYGIDYFKGTEKLIEENRRKISKYFPRANGSTKAYIKDILKSIKDFEIIFRNIRTLDSILNLSSINRITKLTNDCVDLVDALIEQNMKSNILNKNDKVKKDLIHAIHISAREVEFLNYLYSNAIIFYGAFKNLCKDINTIEES